MRLLAKSRSCDHVGINFTDKGIYIIKEKKNH